MNAHTYQFTVQEFTNIILIYTVEAGDIIDLKAVCILQYHSIICLGHRIATRTKIMIVDQKSGFWVGIRRGS